LFVDSRDRIGSVRKKEPHDAKLGIPGNDGVENFPAAFGALDIAMGHH
jgi:hypothetical protein